MKTLLKAVKTIASWIIALIILFEEWGWEPLQRLASRFAKLPIFRHIERLIVKLPPYPALVVFAIPGATLFPIKLFALKLIASDHAMLGLAIIVIAKIIGTAIVARLFTLTKPTLLQLAWFAFVYDRFTIWKHKVVAYAKASTAWRLASELKASAVTRWRAFKLTHFSHDNAS
ncbi:hypothetical protein A3E97_03255 [Candidatus Uhrbacteria bacterium RIFCSPHIGHO2_12_FULL_47_12]|uniref:Uncharacterized protein n=1 Tax=Candidatus Uhrbacteria bacterium RIFCSPLOWO2_02_FULL_48_18 TaxID=1802408 RepID=A0A1F7V815_9BACT|nr:MAG: hypothetical protein A3E97_03255 [Candidatus Uhrbacteria bacterium RIFCSPHIGHO2_12_FULL_47_12]OGL82212.1 MAG: hypothetical protein A3B20_00445 [Candidatus Uhrbacteria bacterium RIFCSPLOWO2_01_FULL_47_17]OGL86702.1 MAG: hypothetical protein A3I41_05210 [Candidatus Uhrbacteria bacterium RIFCSPLOWO2_02_FULL_48_18]OGL94091.1 MAG: hypothetical protein A3H12_01930 [Candidatus Uhrbacteria bacterium RIFCSPLOWO2_12_FULL_47_9]